MRILTAMIPSHAFACCEATSRRRNWTTKVPPLRSMPEHQSAAQAPLSSAEHELMKLAQSHFVAQSLRAVLLIGLFDVLSCEEPLTVNEMISRLPSPSADPTPTPNTPRAKINRDGLHRCLRLLCTAGVTRETGKGAQDVESAYSLTEMGSTLQTSSSMSSLAWHWTEPSLWKSWAALPEYISGVDERPPFDQANLMSASDYYSSSPESRRHRNAVAKWASGMELPAILDSWKQTEILPDLNGKVICDVGGGYGEAAIAMKRAFGNLRKCFCLDLVEVINDAPDVEGVDLIAGDMFDSTTIPECDVILTKHVLCDFDDDDVVTALVSFKEALLDDGRVVIADAVLPNDENLNEWSPTVSFDVCLSLTGRRAERSKREWSRLAKMAGFEVIGSFSTSAVTVDLLVLSVIHQPVLK